MEKIYISGDYIQLDQFFKKMDFISSGGETAFFLENHRISLEGKKVSEKRKKIHIGETLSIDEKEFLFLEEKE